MCVCVCMCMYVHMCVCVCVCVSTHKPLCLFVREKDAGKEGIRQTH